MLGEVRAELKMGDTVEDKAGGGGGGGNKPVDCGKLDGGTGVVGIMGNGGIVLMPWFMSRNLRALATSSLSDFLRLLGVVSPLSVWLLGLGGLFFSEFLLRGFFLVFEVLTAGEFS